MVNGVYEILIIKTGALGDVVRTSYFVKFIKEAYINCELYWYTSSFAIDIIKK